MRGQKGDVEETSTVWSLGLHLPTVCLSGTPRRDIRVARPSGARWERRKGLMTVMASEARRLHAKLIPTSDGFELHLVGNRAGRVNGDLLAQCASSVFAHAERSGCLDDGLHLSSGCLESMVGHSLQSQCVSEGFGLASDKGGDKRGIYHPTASLDVKVTQAADNVQLHFSGDRAQRVDAEQLADCANAALACAESNACLERGLDITSACVNNLLVGHAVETDCVSKGFGLAATKG